MEFLVKLTAAAPLLAPIINGLSITLVAMAIGFFGLSAYRTHGYLYQLTDTRRAYENWIEFLLPLSRHVRHKKYQDFITLCQGRAGCRSDWHAEHFIASQIFFAGLTFLCSYFLIGVVLGMGLFLPTTLSLCAIFLPILALWEKANTRLKRVTRDLSFFLDYLALAISAGMDFNKALETVVSNAPNSPLRDEFRLIHRSMLFGTTRADALQDFEKKMDSLEVKTFVQNMIQALALGTNTADTLQTISSSLSTKRFQVAEEMAGKISVRMMIPMICFILPTVMLILIGPMMLSFVMGK